MTWFNPVHQYVVTQSRNSGVRVDDVLRRYKGVEVLAVHDHSTVLVQMPVNVQETVAREHPELVIEPNIVYKK